MRHVLNISMPKELAKITEREAKLQHFSSTSEFVRSVLRDWLQNKEIAELRKSQREIKLGKGIELKSIRQTMKK